MTRTQIMNLCHQWADRAKLAWTQVVNGPFPSNTTETDAASGDVSPDQDQGHDVVRSDPPAPRAPGVQGSPP